jgi:hypothetical protein
MLASSNNSSSRAVQTARQSKRIKRVVCIHCGDVYSYPGFTEDHTVRECYCLRPGCNGSPIDLWDAKIAMKENGMTEQGLAKYFGGRVLGLMDDPRHVEPRILMLAPDSGEAKP